MSRDFIIERIEDYWNREHADYAILLTSPWGWGKTYYIQHDVKDYFYSKFPRVSQCMEHGNKKGRFCYLSVGDLVELEVVKERLALESLGPGAKLGKKAVQSCKLISDIAGKTAVSVSESAFKALFDFGLNAALEKIKDEVCIIIDDIERYKGNIEELFSMVHNSFVCKGMRVIYVGNEEELDRIAAQTDCIPYRRIKEKYIRYTIAFKGPVEKVLKDMAKNDSPFGDLWKIELCRNQILPWVDELDGFKNIRMILACIDNYNRFLSMSDEYSVEEYGSELFLIVLFHTAFAFSENPKNLLELDYDNAFQQFVESRSDLKCSPYARLYTSMSYGVPYRNFWSVRKAVYRFVRDGYLEQDIINNYIKGSFPKSCEGDRIFRSLKSPDEAESDEMRKAYSKLACLIDSKSLSYGQLDAAMTWLLIVYQFMDDSDKEELSQKLCSCAQDKDYPGREDYFRSEPRVADRLESELSPVGKVVKAEYQKWKEDQDKNELIHSLEKLNSSDCTNWSKCVNDLIFNFNRFGLSSEVGKLKNPALHWIEAYLHGGGISEAMLDGARGLSEELRRLAVAEEDPIQKRRYEHTIHLLDEKIENVGEAYPKFIQ